MCALPLFHSVGCVYHTMQVSCRSSSKQQKSSCHVRGHTDSPTVLGDGKLEGSCQWKVFHVSPPSSGVHSCMLMMACRSFGGQCELHTYIHTVHDTEFRGCSAWTPADSCAKRRGFSAQVLRNLRAGGRRFSVRAGADLRGFGLKMAETRRQTSCTTTG